MNEADILLTIITVFCSISSVVLAIYAASRNSKKDTAAQATTLAKIETKVDQISIDVRDIKLQNLDARLRVVEEKLGGTHK
jgi:uncharacterized protein YpmB